MREHIFFHLAFFSQILLISFYVPRKLASRMAQVLEDYPPSTYPKLYPKSIEHYEARRRNYWYLNVFIFSAGLLILAALLARPHDADLDNAIALGYFLTQALPMILLDLSSLKHAKLMRNANMRSTRTAELQPRRFFDFVSPVLFSVAILLFLGAIVFVAYVKQFDYPWFGGYENIAILTLANLFFAGIVVWKIYGKKLNPHEANEDRNRNIQATARVMVLTSIAVTLFLIINVTLRALDMRDLMPGALSLYFQLLVVISLQAYLVDIKNPDVYREDPSLT